jgi:hypothetical protein
VLPNDKVYVISGADTSSFTDMLTGQGLSNNGTFTANVTDFSGTSSPIAATISATYVVGSSISGSITENGTTKTFTGTPIPNSQFNYSSPAVLSEIAGITWTGSVLEGGLAFATVAANGTFSGSDNQGCPISGTASPDSSKKNVFDVSLAYGGSSCGQPQQAYSGIGVEYLLSDGVTRQLLVAVTGGNQQGDLFVGMSGGQSSTPTMNGTWSFSLTSTVNAAYTVTLTGALTQLPTNDNCKQTYPNLPCNDLIGTLVASDSKGTCFKNVTAPVNGGISGSAFFLEGDYTPYDPSLPEPGLSEQTVNIQGTISTLTTSSGTVIGTYTVLGTGCDADDQGNMGGQKK